MPAQGDVVLVPVPFTDLSVQKRRPVIVVSNDDYHRATADFVAVALTSQPQHSRGSNAARIQALDPPGSFVNVVTASDRRGGHGRPRFA
jgi:mRNA-degrading endonuclease toxin of MazEF toxin-antitoxin module